MPQSTPNPGDLDFILSDAWSWTAPPDWPEGLSPEEEAEVDARDEDWRAAFAERLYWSLCLLSQSDGMVPWDFHNGFEDPIWGALDESTRGDFMLGRITSNEEDQTWLRFSIEEHAEGALDRLIEEERVEVVVRNGVPCFHLPGSVEHVARWIHHAPARLREKFLERATRLGELRALPYADYLASDEWRRRRQVHLDAALHRCQLCNRKQSGRLRLHVHHRTYDRLAAERYSDLIVLCADCHEDFHRRRGPRRR